MWTTNEVAIATVAYNKSRENNIQYRWKGVFFCVQIVKEKRKLNVELLKLEYIFPPNT